MRLVRHLMNFRVDEFAEAIGVTRQTVNNLETKRTKLSATQYIALAALVDTYFAQNKRLLTALKAILDSDGKNYGAEYETAFRDDSLLKRWFEDFVGFDDDENLSDLEEFSLTTLVHDYKIFLDAKTLMMEDADAFVEFLTAALVDADEKVIVPLRSIEELGADNYQAKRFLAQMRTDGILDVRGGKDDPNFHDTIFSVFKKFRGKYRLCLVTPNEFLAYEVLRMNDSAGKEDLEIAAGFVERSTFKFYDRALLEAESKFMDEGYAFSGWKVI